MKIQGSIVALVTPMNADGSVDLDSMRRLMDWQIAEGTDAFVIVGTTGESPTVNVDEHAELIRVAVEHSGKRVPIIAGAGGNSTAEAIVLTRYSKMAGADATLQVVPYYNKPTQPGVYAHFSTVAKATDTPVMLYDIPGRAGIPIAPETYRRLAEIDSIVAVKDAKADFGAATEVMATTDLHYYSGDDGLTLPWMAMGAVGLVSVTAHVAPNLFRALIDAVVAQDLVEAQRLHLELAPIVRATMGRAPGCVAAKEILAWQGVLGQPVVRLPHVLSEPEVLAAMREDLMTSSLAHTLKNA